MRPSQTVLVVEDSAAEAAALQRVLESAGYAVASADAIGDAEALIKSTPISCAFLDVRLAKDVLVFPVAAQLRARSIPFVFTTDLDREYARRHGFKEITLLKPLDSGAVAKIARLLTTSPAY